MKFAQAELTEEDWKECTDENGVLDIEKYNRIEHKRALEQGLTNIEDFDEYIGFLKTFCRTWM